MAHDGISRHEVITQHRWEFLVHDVIFNQHQGHVDGLQLPNHFGRNVTIVGDHQTLHFGFKAGT